VIAVQLLGVGEPKKREPVRKSDKKWILEYVQKGKCANCHKSIKQMKVRPIVHHKNLNPMDNRPQNLIVICPNCHDKIHQKEKKVRKRFTGPWGSTEYRVVKVRPRKKTKKKKTTKRRKGKKKTDFGILMPKIKMPSIKIPKIKLGL
jgi:hypothetical protein